MIAIVQETTTALDEYVRVPIAVEVASVMAVAHDPSGRLTLTEHAIGQPYVKDYDAIENPPLWARRFDMSGWGIFTANVGGTRAGGAIVAGDTTEYGMARSIDTATLWDLRVAPVARRRGVGTALFRAAEAWAIARGCRELVIETQNINVPACRFYAAQGCALRSARPFAYPEFPHEIQLLWYKELHGR